MNATEAPEPPRLRVDGGNLTLVGPRAEVTLSVERLATTWNGWQALESGLRGLQPPLTPEEWALLDQIPTAQSARNGLAELKSALRAR